MFLYDGSKPLDPVKRYEYLQLSRVKSAGHESSLHYAANEQAELQVENFVRVYINGEPTMNLTCSPDHIVELVLGRLYTEGMISGPDEVEEINLCEYSTRAMVYLHDREAKRSNKHVDTVPSCCTFNRNLNDYFNLDEEVQPVKPIAWRPEWVFEMAKTFEADTPLHKRTYGTHSCYLAKDEQVLYVCEDLGRHNAFDKVVGCALRDGVDLTQCMIFTSGRIPTDMVMKAIRAGIPMLISKAVPTDLTIDLARQYQLTLVCSAHSDALNVFNDPLGIAEKDGVWKAC